MNNQEYWENRAVWRMYEDMQKAEETSNDIAKVYLKASRWLQLEMEGIFERYMTHYRNFCRILRMVNPTGRKGNFWQSWKLRHIRPGYQDLQIYKDRLMQSCRLFISRRDRSAQLFTNVWRKKLIIVLFLRFRKNPDWHLDFRALIKNR